MRRRGLLIVSGVLLLTLALLALMPWWAGFAAKRVASRYGVTFATYDRIGYTRFSLRNVEVRRGTVLVKIAIVEADTPLLWSWRHFRGRATHVVAGEWSVDVASRRTRPPDRTGVSGWLPLRGRLQRIAAVLDRWLPQAEVGRGTVHWPGGGLSLKGATWRQQALAVSELKYAVLSADATLAFVPGEDRMSIVAVQAEDGAKAELESRGDKVTGRVVWWEQPCRLDAQFAPQGWMPAEASLIGDALRIPATRLKLAPLYSYVAGHARIDWRKDHFLTDVAFHSEPVAGKAAPPLDVALRGRSDGRAFTVEELRAMLPGGVATLSSPVTIERSGQIRGEGAEFSVRMDLGQQPWIDAKGVVTGEARVVSAAGRAPAVNFSVSADALSAYGTAIQRLQVTARLDWPGLEVRELLVAAPSGESLRGSGGWNFRERRVINASIAGTLAPGLFGRWVPAAIRFKRGLVDARASGALNELSHEGRIELSEVVVSQVRPAQLSVDWRGRGSVISSFNAAVNVGDARLQGAGAIDKSGMRLTQLVFSDHGAPALSLTEPAHVAWQPGIAIDALRLKGPNATMDLSLTWGTSGKIEVAAHGFSAAWLNSFVPMRGPNWIVTSLAVTGTWDQQPLIFSAAGELLVPLPDGRTATANIATRGRADGLFIEALHVVESGQEVANASGQVPIHFTPGQPKLVVVDPNGKLQFDAATVANAAFWAQLAAMSGVEVRSPQVFAKLKGTWARPEGEIAFRAERAAMDPKRFARPLPSIEGIDVALSADGRGIQLERFWFTIERQLVRASGRLPVENDAWGELARAPVAYLRRGAQLRVEVPDAEVAMFSRFLPAALAPAGRLKADLHFDRGALGGFLNLRDAASRPLGPLGVLQGVSADVEFVDYKVNLRRVTATSGGQPVTLTGSVEIPQGSWAGESQAEPRYDVSLQGKNLPFVRQAGLLMRGDLDLKLQSSAQGSASISGTVILRDSLFLTDIRAMLPHGGGASPARRPPYFAVETRPLNTWNLDVEVTGERFLRVRTPVFAGVASSRFHLGGTLGEPRAIGDATIDEGQVMMPFASFEVQQGAVRLTEESPYEPAIFLRGTGRHYGYDLAMEVSGKASSPDITFTSSPALDSEQVLLMVMTGAAPSNEVNTSLTHRAVQIGAFFGQSLVGSLTGDSARPDRLSIESGAKISRQGKETYSIEYKLNNRWSVTGEYDEFDEYNAGLKWRVAPKAKR